MSASIAKLYGELGPLKAATSCRFSISCLTKLSNNTSQFELSIASKMKAVFVFIATLAVVAAEPPSYGVPAISPSGNYAPSGGYQGQQEQYQSQVFRHVYVHTAPDEPVDSQARVIRVPGGDKHVNIIFVKTPSSSSQQQTEVILPEQDEQKNLVYVLLKKGDASSDIKIRKPAASRPQKPEVYFIRYQDQAQNSGYPAQQPSYGAPAAAPIRAIPSTQYGF